MTTFLTRIDSAPLQDLDLSTDFEVWISNLVDTLNDDLNLIQDSVNLYNDGLKFPQFTTAEITALALTADDGTSWYDTDTNNIKAKIGGVVVVVA